MEHDVDVRHQAADQITIADIALDDLDGSVRHGPRQVLPPAADEVVQDHDLLGTGEYELVREIGTDRAGTTGHEHLA